MGANAQTTVPTFTAAQVLTADQMNQSARTGVPVFADTTARDAAFGGSGEKTLAEGQLCYLESTDVVQYYNGSTWATLGPTTDPGLVLISSTTIGSAVASVTVSNAFSATYDNYKVVVSGGAASTNNFLNLTFGATATGYYWSTNTLSWARAVNQQGNGNEPSIGRVVAGTAQSLAGWFDVHLPFAADQTSVFYQTVATQTSGGNEVGGAYLNDTSSYTAFTLTCSTGTMTGGTVKVYGYRN
jgi:hypothetical protein